MIILLSIVVWIVIGFICGGIASSKNRSTVGWFFLGLLIGPFALLILAVASPNEEKTNLLQYKKCPYCAEQIKAEAIVCRFCNRELSIENTEKTSQYADDIKKGKMLIRQGLYPEALDLFSKIIEKDPKNSEARYARAAIYNHKNEDGSMLTDLIVAAKNGHEKAKSILTSKNIGY